MARPEKLGLNYFPLEINIFEDDKLQLLSSDFGIKGEIIYIRLLCKIYKNGYFYQWGEDEAGLFAKGVGDGVNRALVNEVLQGCLRRSLFDERVFKMSKILTSKGIQERYQTICKQLKRPVRIDERYDCRVLTQLKRGLSPDKVGFSGEETQIIQEETGQSKVKETKLKERKLRERTLDDAEWLKNTALAYLVTEDVLQAHCQQWITKAIAKGTFDTDYSIISMQKWMLDDLEKSKTIKPEHQAGKNIPDED